MCTLNFDCIYIYIYIYLLKLSLTLSSQVSTRCPGITGTSTVEKEVDVVAEKSLSIHSGPKFPKTKINLIVY